MRNIVAIAIGYDDLHSVRLEVRVPVKQKRRKYLRFSLHPASHGGQFLIEKNVHPMSHIVYR